MFYLYAIGSMAAYALQNTLLVRHARSMDGLRVAFYRNLSFVFTLSPLLLWAAPGEVSSVLSRWPTLLLAATTGGVSLWLMFGSFKYLGASFSSALTISITTLSTVAFGWAVFDERPSMKMLALILLIIAGVLTFGLNYKHFPHLDSKFLLGVTCALGGGFLNSFSKFTVSVLSRQAGPFASGYFWEVSIGFACVVLVLIRQFFHRQPLHKATPGELVTIAACASPTLVGTGLFCLAVKEGPVAVVGAIGSSALVVVSLLAWSLYGERVTPKQWIAISMILLGVGGLRFFSLS
jgi:drug/metabolite transporter (DMT)-like permease